MPVIIVEKRRIRRNPDIDQVFIIEKKIKEPGSIGKKVFIWIFCTWIAWIIYLIIKPLWSN